MPVLPKVARVISPLTQCAVDLPSAVTGSELTMNLPLVGLLSACALAAGPTIAGPDPLAGRWRVGRVERVAVPASSQRRTYIVFHDGELFGMDGCSGFSGGYVGNAGGFRTSPGMTTADYCRSPDDPDLMRRADRLQALVAQIDGYRRRGATIILSARGDDALELTRAPDTDRIQTVGGEDRMTILTDPQWSQRPSAEQLSKAKSDLSVGADRSMQLHCAISPTGGLIDCNLVYPRTPQPGSNALRDALDLIEVYRLSPHDTLLAKRTHASILMDITLWPGR